MRIALVVSLLISTQALAAPRGTRLAAFRKDAQQFGMVYALPAGYREVAVVDNRDMQYDFAIRHPQNKIEVRYALRPQSQEHKKMYADFVAGKLAAGSVVIDPNVSYDNELLAVALNVAGGNEPEPPRPFPPEAVKREFGADGGFTTLVKIGRSAFGKGWKQVSLFVIHRDDLGEAYVFILYNDPADFSNYGREVYYSLKFARSDEAK